MDIKEIIRIISSEYSPLSSSCKDALMKKANVLCLKKEELLIKEGQYVNKVYFVVSGGARVFYYKDGKDVTDWFAFENHFITSINSFFMQIPSPHYLEVLEPSVLLEISRENMILLSDSYRDFERLEKIIVTQTMLQLQNRITAMQFETAQQKYENLTTIMPNILQKAPLTHIASFLGITLETLSRIRSSK